MTIEWKRIILMSLIVSVSIFCVIMLVSFLFNYPNMLIKGLIIFVVLFFVFVLIFYLTRDKKNIFVASILNFSFIYPLGFMYTTEHVLPSISPKEIAFFVIHYVLGPISPIITLLAASMGLYPVKDGDQLTFY